MKNFIFVLLFNYMSNTETLYKLFWNPEVYRIKTSKPTFKLTAANSISFCDITMQFPYLYINTWFFPPSFKICLGVLFIWFILFFLITSEFSIVAIWYNFIYNSLITEQFVHIFAINKLYSGEFSFICLCTQVPVSNICS